MKRSSWHYKLTRWFWGRIEDEGPISLCKYFWMWVVACVFSIPIIVLSAPVQIPLALYSEKKLFFDVNDFYDFWFFRIAFPFFGIVAYVVMYVIISEPLIVAMALGGILVVLGLPILFAYLYLNSRNSSNPLILMIKAKKKKICPVLKFED